MKRILASVKHRCKGQGLQKDIKDSFENDITSTLEKADKGYLPKGDWNLTFRRKMVHQVELLGKRKLCRDSR